MVFGAVTSLPSIGTSGGSPELSLVSEEIERGWDYDPACWAPGPGGHDGTTLEDALLDDDYHAGLGSGRGIT